MQWHPVLKSLHWLMAVLLLAMLAMGFTMSRLAHAAATTGDYSVTLLGLSIFDAFQLHKSIGVLLFALLVARGVIRFATKAPHHAHLKPIERRAAALVHLGLYCLMLTMPITGWLLASSSPLGIPTIVFGLFSLPHPIHPSTGAEMLFGWLHFLGGCALGALAAMHIAAALKHHFVDRDDVLTSMLPALLRLRERRKP
ncbi:cytochrome b/b6 domain-containing protein [Yoonia sp. BS5-3]|uniref:Cytochrome b n=1 Tax=Yoonia phaeophyticola TaxID=3137369 RepID=A0ABZ2V6C2_9RHOB